MLGGLTGKVEKWSNKWYPYKLLSVSTFPALSESFRLTGQLFTETPAADAELASFSTQAEQEAMLWLRANTTPNVVARRGADPEVVGESQ